MPTATEEHTNHYPLLQTLQKSLQQKKTTEITAGKMSCFNKAQNSDPQGN
jgi:hypothetical protein